MSSRVHLCPTAALLCGSRTNMRRSNASGSRDSLQIKVHHTADFHKVPPQRERRLRTETGPPAPAEGPAVAFVDRYLEKHISTHALVSKVKINPLFPAQRSEDTEDGVKVQPSWTVEDYHAQTCADLTEHLKVRGHADES